MQTLIVHPLFIALVMGGFAFGVAFFNNRQLKKFSSETVLEKQKVSLKKDLDERFDKKVDVEDCAPAMKRVGKEVDTHGTSIYTLQKGQTKIEKILILIAERMKIDLSNANIIE